MKNFIIIILLVAVIGMISIFVLKNGNAGNADEGSTTKAQDIVLSFKNYNYYPNTITVRAGQPVRISLDSSVTGCYRAFTIRDFGISKHLQTPQDFIEFTPQQKGTFRFSCSMGMGTGTLIIE